MEGLLWFGGKKTKLKWAFGVTENRPRCSCVLEGVDTDVQSKQGGGDGFARFEDQDSTTKFKAKCNLAKHESETPTCSMVHLVGPGGQGRTTRRS